VTEITRGWAESIWRHLLVCLRRLIIGRVHAPGRRSFIISRGSTATDPNVDAPTTAFVAFRAASDDTAGIDLWWVLRLAGGFRLHPCMSHDPCVNRFSYLYSDALLGQGMSLCGQTLDGLFRAIDLRT
jgi:hypothetical protein